MSPIRTQVGTADESSGPWRSELARLAGNISGIHHDLGLGGGSLHVYEGQTIGIALAQACRLIPNPVTVTGWHRCDHPAPVREHDALSSTVTVQSVEPLAQGGGLAHPRSVVRALNERDGEPRDVLDWRYVAVLA